MWDVKNLLVSLSVVTVAGICNWVGGGVFLTCHRGAGGGGEITEYRSVSRLGLLIGNRWMSKRDQIPAVLLKACNSRSALSETVTAVSLSTVPCRRAFTQSNDTAFK